MQLKILPIFFMVASLVLGQSNDCYGYVHSNIIRIFGLASVLLQQSYMIAPMPPKQPCRIWVKVSHGYKLHNHPYYSVYVIPALIARFMGPMLATWTLLSGLFLSTILVSDYALCLRLWYTLSQAVKKIPNLNSHLSHCFIKMYIILCILWYWNHWVVYWDEKYRNLY